VLLKNQIDNNKEVLPLKKNIKIFVDGFDKNEIKKYCEITDDPKEADYIIAQLRTVFNGNQPSGVDRPIDNFLSTIFPNNDLNYDDKILSKLKKYSSLSKLITVVDLNRPAILTDIEKLSHGLIGVFGVFDEVVLEIIFGNFNPTGKLPFDIPSSMKEVNDQLSDVPNDTKNPIFRYGHGLSYLKE
jgi:beta-glucosidase